jgi:hypothetical protein
MENLDVQGEQCTSTEQASLGINCFARSFPLKLDDYVLYLLLGRNLPYAMYYGSHCRRSIALHAKRSVLL